MQSILTKIKDAFFAKAKGGGYIIIKPTEGLGNRLRVVVAFQELAEKLNKSLLVYWTSSPGFDDTGFYELFDEAFPLQLISKEAWEAYRANSLHFDTTTEFVYDEEVGENTKHFVEVVNFGQLKRSAQNLSYEGQREYIDHLGPGQAKMWNGYFERKAELYQRLRPSKSLQQMIDSLMKEEITIGPQTYGIHIRRGDAVIGAYKASHLKSSDDAFEEKMRSILEKEPSANFFLATDSEATLQKFTQLFGSKISYFDKEFVASEFDKEKRGQKEAALDLFLLAKTKKIFGSHWSTFSQTAALLGNVPLEVVT